MAVSKFNLMTLSLAWMIAVSAGASSAATAAEDFPLNKIRLPPGFEISLYAKMPNARSMVLGPNRTLFVGSRTAGNVYAIATRGEANQDKKPAVIARGLNMPNGVAFRDGALYVAEVNRVLRYDDIESRLNAPPQAAIVNANFPSDKAHGWKFIAFGPDGWLYVPVGAPCNICEPDSNRYANLQRMRVDGGVPEVFARGIRNTVGFDWHPQ